ncbi:hypothetical protein [Solicola gregarius]|uniref:Integral membrane protein n=1 Tax=Solicola gregarius TaxID=2908642 RepID=A0AA46TEB3_9ACTN|nr:hypothetical protein [Solicola gregarius]UYM03618.1 hypothetical protein L0C25_13775 [Solicola gregarius]
MTDASDDATRDEIDALRAEVERLREGASTGGSPGRRRGWWRTPVVFLLVLIAAITAPLSVVATWARDQIVDTDRYLETIEPLDSDPAVRDAIADRITHEILTRIDLPAVTDQALTALSKQQFVPERARPLLPALATPLSSAVEDFIAERVNRLVQSDEFGDAWIEANRQAHDQMVAVLTGDGTENVDVSNGEVRVNLASFIDAAKKRLVDDGFALASNVPTVNASFTIFASSDVEKAQAAVGWLELSARVLPAIGLALLVVALVIASDRRRTALAIGLSVAASMLLLGIGLNVVRQLYLDSVPPSVLPLDVAATIYDTLIRFLRTALRAVAVVALVIALVAYVLAPSGSGRRVRTALASGIDRLRAGSSKAGLETGPFGAFLGRNRGLLRVAICVVGAVGYLSIDHPSGTSALVVVLCIGIAVVVLEVLAVPPPADADDDTDADAAASSGPSEQA